MIIMMWSYNTHHHPFTTSRVGRETGRRCSPPWRSGWRRGHHHCTHHHRHRSDHLHHRQHHCRFHVFIVVIIVMVSFMKMMIIMIDPKGDEKKCSTGVRGERGSTKSSKKYGHKVNTINMLLIGIIFMILL